MKTSQKKRILKALLKGETVSRLWAAKQIPLIAQPGNRCNELRADGFPIEKIMVYPKEGAHYMAFFMKSEQIQRVKKEFKR